MEPDPSAAEIFSREFFFGHSGAVSTHEEWLLRMCSQLMHREASVISMMEANVAQQQHARRRRRSWKSSSSDSPAFNSASTGTDPETSETS